MPVVATVAGVSILGERITLATLAGFLVVFAGFVVLKRRAIAALVSDTAVAVGRAGD